MTLRHAAGEFRLQRRGVCQFDLDESAENSAPRRRGFPRPRSALAGGSRPWWSDGRERVLAAHEYVKTHGKLDKGQKEVQGLLQKEASKVFGGLDDLLTPKARPKPAAVPPAPVQPTPMMP